MKISHHLTHTLHTARHRAHHILLISIVDTHIRIGSPYEHSIDAPIAFLQIIEIPIYGVLAGDWIVEVTIEHHHLWLDETGLCPFQSAPFIARRIISDANEALPAPMCHIVEPLLVDLRGARSIRAFPWPVESKAGGRRNLLALRHKPRILRNQR